MITIVEKTDCCGCSACETVCPKKCVQLTWDEEGFSYPKVKETECIDCGLCEAVCPIKHPPKQAENKGVYAIKNKAEKIRLESSSGGVFSLLAEQAIASEGVVFGAVMKGHKVVHTAITTKEELFRLRGSKYVQSEMGDCFGQVKSQLEAGKLVLFSGTPCQVGGLHTFLRKPYENLISVDCICMGVPSPKVWGKYIAFLEEKQGASASNIVFRDKTNGWKNYNLRIDFANETTYQKPHKEDLYLKGFGKCLFLRPSCHACAFKSFHSSADITLGDYWGVHTLIADFDDDKGVSLVLTHTKKGEEKLAEINESLVVKEATLEHAIQTHRSMVQSIDPNGKRASFFAQIETAEIENLLEQYAKDSMAEKAKHMAGGILRKMKLRK